MRVLFAGGGTGGHLYPALAVCREIRAMNPGARIDWVGSKGRIEERVVPAEGISFRGFYITGIDRSRRGPSALFKAATSILGLFRAAASLFIDFIADPPAAVVVSGAYISVPAALAAIVTGTPLYILEQNSIPGVANRLLSSFATAVFATFDSSIGRFPKRARVIVAGNPIRKGIAEVRKGRLCDRGSLEAMRKRAISTFGLEPERKLLVVMGGSLGSETLTLGVLDALDVMASRSSEAAQNAARAVGQCDEFAGQWQFLFITGGRKNEIPRVEEKWRVFFIDYADDMDLLYAAADAMVARAGASTVTEILALGLPSILVPWSGSAEGHQVLNASLPGSLGCAVVDETGLDRRGMSDALASHLHDLFAKSSDRETIFAIASGGKPSAGPATAKIVLGIREGA